VSKDGRVWRAALGYRLFVSLVAVVLLAGAALPTDDGVVTFPLSGGYGDGIAYRLLAVVVAALFLALVHRARMEIRGRDLVMRYTLWSRSIPLAEITRVTAGREGLTVETCEGATHGSPAFIGGKAPLVAWLRRRTRSDAIAEQIMAARPDV
jgi:hypothetical protein